MLNPNFGTAWVTNVLSTKPKGRDLEPCIAVFGSAAASGGTICLKMTGLWISKSWDTNMDIFNI